MPQDRIWLCGDVHGDLRALHRALAQAVEPPLAVILLGDLDPPQPVGEWLAGIGASGAETWCIHGNHETDNADFHDRTFLAEGSDRNLDGQVVEIAGLRVAGLGGVFREAVWYPPAPPVFESYAAYVSESVPRWGHADGRKAVIKNRVRKHRSSIFSDVYNQLADQEADVLIVHEAPSCHPRGFEEIDLLAKGMGVRLVVHGHHHQSWRFPYCERLGFHAVGLGLRGVLRRRDISRDLEQLTWPIKR